MEKVSISVLLTVLPAMAMAQECSPAPALPAYAHNDYYETNPLQDAVALGFQGVEVDYLLVGGELLVGHGRAEVTPGRTLERLYLAPLRDRVRKCGWVQSSDRPFLLTIDYKDQGPRGYRRLLEVLKKYQDVIGASGKPGAVRVVLVGWHPPLPELAQDTLRLATVQARISRSGLAVPRGDSVLVGLLSIDYEKTLSWRGRGQMSDADRRILQHIAEARRRLPGRLVRAYHVPADSAVYRLLLRSGVDLIGATNLKTAAELLGHN